MDGQDFYAAPETTIEPDQPEFGWYGDERLATRMQRLGAMLLDAVFLGLALIPLFGLAVAIELGKSMEVEVMAAVGGAGVLAILGFAGVNLWFLYDNGQTLGKKIVRIKIIRDDLTTRASLLRIIFLRIFPVFLLTFLSCIGGMLWLVNHLMIFADERRCIHDYIAGTHVVVDDGVAGLSGAETQGYLESGSFYERPNSSAESSAWNDPSDDGYTSNKGF